MNSTKKSDVRKPERLSEYNIVTNTGSLVESYKNQIVNSNKYDNIIETSRNDT